jgi:hypothetical protein
MNVLDRSPHGYATALCLGLAGANLIRGSTPVALCLCAGLALGTAGREARPILLLAALALLGWWWGSARLDALDRSVLLGHVDTSERSVLAVTGPTRHSRFELRVPAQIRRFGRLRFREAVLLELPLGRSPPQGALIETVHGPVPEAAQEPLRRDDLAAASRSPRRAASRSLASDRQPRRARRHR